MYCKWKILNASKVSEPNERTFQQNKISRSRMEMLQYKVLQGRCEGEDAKNEEVER